MPGLTCSFPTNCTACKGEVELQAVNVTPGGKWRKTVWHCPWCEAYNTDHLQGTLVWVVRGYHGETVEIH